ncbi:hypothetical protein FisN_7Lh347 [Fistulifera solaris]|uniref:Uncharacterized protein n=1 Tax=Fistulifera solaris TaxID=1519565 RepID=A0A1Z5JRY7_FISSO|nr:hypothetical protein FisN_7Lh347 [Fistulifera solaris]|eukprot:GAX16612.1 hypothetical protein FisN_7Lh347 [Fistulifera solaris]
MPPVLDPSRSKVDGLAFLGLSLARSSDVGHPQSVTQQTAFDLNEIQDRAYEFVFSTNDDGWLVGGGEPLDSYKLPAPDSAHVEIMRIGTYRPEWGGLDREKLIAALQSGDILIPQIEVVPTAVVANGDVPPELEIRFDMDYEVGSEEEFMHCKDENLPVNWQLRFLHNQLFHKFQFPSRFCPGAHHSTILRKADFRSLKHRDAYFQKCDQVVSQWRTKGVQPLVWDPANDTPGIQRLACQHHQGQVINDPTHQSGLYLFTDRTRITHHFAPNFLPPYNTPEKRQIIYKFLKEQWNETTLSWQPVVSKKRQLDEQDIDNK